MNKSTAGDKRQSISAIKSVDYTIRFGDITKCDFTKCRFQKTLIKSNGNVIERIIKNG